MTRDDTEDEISKILKGETKTTQNFLEVEMQPLQSHRV
jgi:hypothetical protein